LISRKERLITTYYRLVEGFIVLPYSNQSSWRMSFPGQFRNPWCCGRCGALPECVVATPRHSDSFRQFSFSRSDVRFLHVYATDLARLFAATCRRPVGGRASATAHPTRKTRLVNYTNLSFFRFLGMRSSST